MEDKKSFEDTSELESFDLEKKLAPGLSFFYVRSIWWKYLRLNLRATAAVKIFGKIQAFKHKINFIISKKVQIFWGRMFLMQFYSLKKCWSVLKLSKNYIILFNLEISTCFYPDISIWYWKLSIVYRNYTALFLKLFLVFTVCFLEIYLVL